MRPANARIVPGQDGLNISREARAREFNALHQEIVITGEVEITDECNL